MIMDNVKKTEQIYQDDIMAIIPEYETEMGNCTLIYTEKETIKLKITIKTFMRNLYKHYHIDPKAMSKTYGELLLCKYCPPMALSREDIFIQLKIRKPIGRQDGAYGYFNLKYIDRVEEDKNGTTIYFTNGERIQCLFTIDTVRKMMKNGEIIKMFLKNKGVPSIEDDNIYVYEDIPATKSDIVRLYKKIAELNEKI